MIFDGEFDTPYIKVFDYFFSKTKTEEEIIELKTHFDLVEKQFELVEKEIEEEAILILSKVEVESRKRISENRTIKYNLRLKRKWQPWYEDELKIVKNNCELNNEAYKLVEENTLYIKFDKDKLDHFKKLQYELSNPFHHYNALLDKINGLYGKPFSSKKQNSASRLIKEKRFSAPSSRTQPKNVSGNTISNEAHLVNNEARKNETQNQEKNNKVLNEFDEQHTKTNDVKRNKIIELPNSSIENNLKQLELDFESPKINLKSVDEIPLQRNSPKYRRIINASSEFYLKVADKKMDIGRKGELLVMEYEKQRLIDEEENVEKRLRHTSVEDGDGYGYDICSFENDKKIFIEVKTTTGSFWSNLFFTQNEFDVMNKYDEEYYLYRVCNFDTETNLGELFIFKGKEMINSFFEFQSKVYVLTDKNKTII